MKLTGKYKLQQLRKGEVIREIEINNFITTEGKNHVLNVLFAGDTQVDPWYIGLINNSPTPTLSVSDTAASHGGWSEFTSYDEATRETYVDDTVAGGSVTTTSGSEAEFTISASGNIYGMFVISNNTKGGSTGTLLSEAALSEVIPVVDDDVIKITYTAGLT